MKRLILIRHAKSSWKEENLSDFERPLSKRWFKELDFLKKILKKLDLKIDFVISSSSNRTKETLKNIFKSLKIKEKNIVYDKLIYDNNNSSKLDYYIDLISKTDNSKNNIWLVWHNYFITNLLRFLTWNENLELKTGSIVIIDFDIENWENIKNKKWDIRFFISPKYFI